MPRISIAFLIAAAVCLVVGVAMGIVMGIAKQFQLAPVHAHLNLLGWTSLALIGLTHRAWPALADDPRLSAVQFVLSASGALAMPAGIWVAMTQGQIALAIGGALAFLAGALLFLARLVLLARQPA
jgi:hypothetical protein